MRQLLLRVPDDLHERLSARATQTGQSVNALANQALATAVGGAPDDERTRVRMRAAAAGLLVEAEEPRGFASRDRAQTVAATALGYQVI
jgi:plasmid stability protein